MLKVWFQLEVEREDWRMYEEYGRVRGQLCGVDFLYENRNWWRTVDASVIVPFLAEELKYLYRFWALLMSCSNGESEAWLFSVTAMFFSFSHQHLTQSRRAVVMEVECSILKIHLLMLYEILFPFKLRIGLTVSLNMSRMQPSQSRPSFMHDQKNAIGQKAISCTRASLMLCE